MSNLSIEPVGGGRWRLSAEQVFSRPLDEIFSFFSEPSNLEVLTPPWLSFRILTPPPITMRPGLLIDYRIRLHGLPLTWRSEITAYEPGLRFVDEQRKGPYREWIHEHTFVEENGETIVGDTVLYRPPGGALVNRFFVEPDVRKIFAYRQQRMDALFAE